MQNLGFIRSFQACKQSFCVLCRCGFDFFKRDAKHLGGFFCNKRDVFRLVDFAPVRHGSHIRAVGFQKKPVFWNARKRLDIMLCVFECYCAPESIVCVELVKNFDILARARIAVQKQTVANIFLHIEKDLSCILVCVPNVQNYGQFRFVCKLDLSCKCASLHLSFAQIVIVIKPYFADCDNFSVFCKFKYSLAIFISQSVRIVRMYSDCGIHPVILFAN